MPIGTVTSLLVAGGNLFAATTNGIYRLQDNDDTWAPINEGFAPWVTETGDTSFSVMRLAVKGDSLFAGTWGNGVFVRPLSEVSATTQLNRPLPDETGFGFHAPGIFEPGEKIEFHIKQSGSVRLRIFDLEGNSRSDLVHSELAPGMHQVSLPSSGLPAGLYYLRLEADGTSRTRSLVLGK